MKKKMNNKGFSLVELIVVIAIMAILAVTLAPRLMHYVDKARQANDKEVINSIYTAVKYSLVDEEIYGDVHGTGTTITNKAGNTTYDSATESYTTVIRLHAGIDDTLGNTDDLYTVSSNQWNKKTSTNKFISEIYNVVGKFKLQSQKAKATAEIVITIIGSDQFTIQLDYDAYDGGSTYPATRTYDYTLDSSSAS